MGVYQDTDTDPLLFHELGLELIEELISMIHIPVTKHYEFERVLEDIYNLLVITKKTDLILPSGMLLLFDLTKDMITRYDTPRKNGDPWVPSFFSDPMTPIFRDIIQKFQESVVLKLIQSEYNKSIFSTTHLPKEASNLIASYVI